jgi:PTS system mannitol-specific IIC component
MIFGKGTAKATSYGAGIIHFFGGIHEIYFPYVLKILLLDKLQHQSFRLK